MKTLFLDTSTERGVVAIFEHAELLFIQELPFGLQNSKILMPTIAEALNRVNLQPNELDLIAVGKGPGSYTGIRVGVAAAQAMAYAHKISLVGISSLYGFIPEEDGIFAAMIDAKIGGVYYIKGKRLGETIEYFSEPALVSPIDIRSHLDDVKRIVTPNEKALKLIFPEKHYVECYPSAQHVVKIALSQPPQDKIDILYLRKTQAEIERGL